jgi:predicted ATPase/class 3 adenylate cyclase
VPVSAESLSALAAYLPQPIVSLLRTDPYREWTGYTQQQPAAVLFVDLVGSTPMTAALTARGREGAEELTSILDRVFTALIFTCEDHGGVVGKFVGDALTVYWPAETERDLPDAVHAALACALALQAQLRELAELPTSIGIFRLAMRVGVAAGTIELRIVGDPQIGLEALLSGWPLLAAAEAQAMANPGEVVAHSSANDQAIGPLRDGAQVVERLPYPPSPHPLPPLTWDAVSNPDDVAALVARFLPPALAELLLMGHGAFAGELRHATSVFVGLAGYPRQPHDEAALEGEEGEGPVIDLAGAVTAAQRVVAAAGGRVNRLSVGDKGTMIHLLFGAPTANEDDAARAVWATRLLWADLTGQYGISAIRAGVATGGVYAGPVGGPTRREYTVMGDTVNLSARLMQIAEPGQVVCDGTTVEEARGTFAWERLPAVMVKGWSQPVEVWLAGAGEGIDRAAPRQGPLIGRQAELAALKQVLKRARQKSGQVIALTGEGGIGKSRLLQSWLMDAFMDGWWVVVGQATVTGHAVPYLPWRALAAEMLACPPDAKIERLTEAATGVLEALEPSLVDHWPLLGDLLGVPFPDTPLTQKMEAGQRREALVELVMRWVTVQASKTPLCLVLEDAQWADESSVALALELARLATDGHGQYAAPAQGLAGSQRVVVALVHRPLSPPLSDTWQALHQMMTETITLGELSPDEVCELATYRFGVSSLPDRLAALLVGRTQGHPFFAEELCRTLQEQGLVRILNGRVQLSADLASAAVPTSIEDLVQSRIDRLDEQTRLTLKVAAVLGSEIPFDALLGSYPVAISPSNLRQHLATLERLDLLPMRASSPSTYEFKHSITQLVAYGSLLEAQRRDLHGRVARYFEETLGSTPGRAIDLLAYHYARSDHRVKAVHYLRLAGEQATRQGSYMVAVDYFGQALERADQVDYADRCAILEAREQIWRMTGNLAARQQDLEALESAAEAGGGALWQARTLFRRAVLAQDQGDHRTADIHLQNVISRAAALADVRLMGLALLERGNLLANWSRYGDALICYEVAANLFEQKAASLHAEAVRRRAEMQRLTGDWAGALASYQEVEYLAEAAGDQAGVAMQRVDHAILYMQLGMFAEAERDLVAAWQWAEQANHRYILMASGAALGELYWNLERCEEAWSYVLIAYALSEEQDNPYYRAQILLASAALWLDGDKPDKALAAAREARSLAAQIESAESEVRAMALEIDALARQDRAMAAHGAWATLDWLVQAEETLSTLPALYLALASAFTATGDQETSYAMIRHAHRLIADQAKNLEPDSLRQSFLGNPRVNRLIQSMWAQVERNPRGGPDNG